MNFLEICKRVRQEAGVSGSGPLTVVGQAGEMGRIVSWVNQAYEVTQLMRTNWNWMRAEFEFETTQGKFAYSPLEVGITERFSQWDADTIKSYRTSVGISNEFELGELLYRKYRSIYLTGPQPSGTPICFSLAPDQKLLIGPKPDSVFTVSGQYWKTPQRLLLDADVPEMPAQFHELIVWQALKDYGMFESAGEVIGRAQEKIRFYMGRLEFNQLPDVQIAAPLI